MSYTLIDVIVPNTIEKYERLYAVVSDRVVAPPQEMYCISVDLMAALLLGFTLLFLWYALGR